MYKRILFVIFLAYCMCVGTYVKYFRRPPVSDILSANKGLVEEDEEALKSLTPEARASKRQWDRWIKANDYVQIGEVFDKCDGDDRLAIGRAILLQDTKLGGVTSKTFLNITFASDVTGGAMYLECQYNGRQLYSSHWDLCTAEDDLEDDKRIIICPMKSGPKSYGTERKIPNYLPKGRYQAKAWFIDQNEQMIACGMADFTI